LDAFLAATQGQFDAAEAQALRGLDLLERNGRDSANPRVVEELNRLLKWIAVERERKR
jgi:hypothetical protein